MKDGHWGKLWCVLAEEGGAIFDKELKNYCLTYEDGMKTDYHEEVMWEGHLWKPGFLLTILEVLEILCSS